MFKRGIKEALPVMAGFFPIAMTFGILAESAGVSIIDGVMMSVFVYAGASQFMAVGMLGTGIGMASIILAVFFMNFRHFIMSASLRSRLTQTKKRYFPIIGFFLTDETYSVISMNEDVDDLVYLNTFQISCYSSWVAGTAAGYIFGMFIPSLITESMGIALYALLVALLMPACKKTESALGVALLSGALNTILVKFTSLDSGGCFIISVLTASFIAVLLQKNKQPEVVCTDEY